MSDKSLTILLGSFSGAQKTAIAACSKETKFIWAAFFSLKYGHKPQNIEHLEKRTPP